MKRILNIIILSVFIILTIVLPVQADNAETNRLKLKVVNSNESYELYILLPKRYIMYAIEHDNLDIKYDGSNTLKYNVIPSITVDINNIQDDTYTDNQIEYVQIKLDDLGGEEYLFEIISEYTDMDMLYRIKSATRDNLMVIDNFNIENNACEMQYDYEQNKISTEKLTNTKVKIQLKWWQILIIVGVIIMAIIVYNWRNY